MSKGDVLNLREAGMATALSIDFWEPTKASKCECENDSTLSVNFVCMHPSPPASVSNADPPNKSEGSRYQEIFIDLVGMICAVNDAASRHVLDDRFDSFLGAGERAFKDSLMDFMHKQTEEAKNTHAYNFLKDMLQSTMGFRNTYFWAQRKKVKRSSMPTHTLRAETSTKAPPNTTNPGHVFVCIGSVCDIQCDAFLCPASISREKNGLTGSVFSQWKRKVLASNHELRDAIRLQERSLLECHDGYDRVVTIKAWPDTPNLPLFVAGEVSLEESQIFADMRTSKVTLPAEEQHIAALMETMKQFLDLAGSLVRKQSPNVFRERYLLAVPVLGTGGGFAGDLTGQIVEELLEHLNGHVTSRSDVDVVLVCADEATYAHAQVVRMNSYRPLDGALKENDLFPCFHSLSSNMQIYADQLAMLASSRHLALFLGAGVSIGSGLPSWFGLLLAIEDFFTPTGDPSERKLGDETKWDPLEMAERLEEICSTYDDRDGNRLSLKERVCHLLMKKGQNPGLLLSLLISLPCHSIVTQNYDKLVEHACQKWCIALRYAGSEAEAKTKRNLSVIPYRPRRDAHYWLLKMHGCVSAPRDIVLTKADYESFEKSPRSQALSGLVQASLLTKHLLFVGFSLTDPNYLRIIDQVRDALRPYPDSSP